MKLRKLIAPMVALAAFSLPATAQLYPVGTSASSSGVIGQINNVVGNVVMQRASGMLYQAQAGSYIERGDTIYSLSSNSSATFSEGSPARGFRPCTEGLGALQSVTVNSLCSDLGAMVPLDQTQVARIGQQSLSQANAGQASLGQSAYGNQVSQVAQVTKTVSVPSTVSAGGAGGMGSLLPIVAGLAAAGFAISELSKDGDNNTGSIPASP